ncbi:hypothetical protein JTE90_016015 [Oedothorax gibbosus]|uniref:Uncharacterized protein n=1 Tax=Oedothorax gibbosus TaxID=931172 RepID=A0AAV6VTU1_9ARAC|nr:hypothetical protein JTE90_016015 [Oedothorax gibbosus]
MGILPGTISKALNHPLALIPGYILPPSHKRSPIQRNVFRESNVCFSAPILPRSTFSKGGGLRVLRMRPLPSSLVAPPSVGRSSLAAVSGMAVL